MEFIYKKFGDCFYYVSIEKDDEILHMGTVRKLDRVWIGKPIIGGTVRETTREKAAEAILKQLEK